MPESWWQTCQEQDALVERLLTAFTDPAAGRGRDQTRRRGLAKLLDWLQSQPGETWQDRWLASGADAAGFDWAALPLGDEPSPGHRRDELTSGLVLLVAAQVIRPAYRLCVPITSSTSCDQPIFVDHATDLSLSSDAVQVEIDWLR